jgi:hypothetical protein
MKAETIFRPWTAQRVREIAKWRAPANTAPGPAGLSDRLLLESTPEFHEMVAELIQASQDTRRMSKGERHSHVYPIPKSGPTGGTLEGARQICLIEVTVKMLTSETGKAVTEEWARRGTLNGWQGGFVKGHAPPDLSATVAALFGIARSKKKPIYAIFGDLAKAFQAVPHWAVEMSLRRLAVPEEVIELWMETDRGRATERGGAEPLATCEMITDWGLTAEYTVDNGVRMGESLSPFKFIAWMDALLCWLEACGVEGVEVAAGKKCRGKAFADDLLLLARTLADARKALALTDGFLRRFGVELLPRKSMAMKVGADWEEERLSVCSGGRKELR